MAHCLACYADDAVAGELFVFRVRFHNERLTVALHESHGQLSLKEVAGRANGLASAAATRAIHSWIALNSGYKKAPDAATTELRREGECE